jgi:hypothetical protein
VGGQAEGVIVIGEEHTLAVPQDCVRPMAEIYIINSGVLLLDAILYLFRGVLILQESGKHFEL